MTHDTPYEKRQHLRNHLRTHLDVTAMYYETKKKRIAPYCSDRVGYTAVKTAFIDKTLSL